ncbi:hypothetical protein JTB14_024999 [Gonioctena quinquepunctata]|nr:hypothetical protein JTB14_024999 [Gonioctena quinquepunctata]
MPANKEIKILSDIKLVASSSSHDKTDDNSRVLPSNDGVTIIVSEILNEILENVYHVVYSRANNENGKIRKRKKYDTNAEECQLMKKEHIEKNINCSALVGKSALKNTHK